MNIKSIYGKLLEWAGLANVPAAVTALAGLKGSVGQIVEISGTDADGVATAFQAVNKPAADGETIPTKVSAFENDAGYQTETQVNALLAAFPTFQIQVVAQLPDAGEEKTIYLVPFADDSGSYLEYLWVNGSWEVIGSRSSGNAALTTAQIDALHGMFKVCAYDDSKDVAGAYAAFKTAFNITDDSGGEEEPDEPVTPEKTLTSISAVYNGGDVAVGTAVADLTGIVVTAHYSDGTSETVTGYTLSGTIAEGSNTVTVSYGGKTTTFTVTGVAESGGDSGSEEINTLPMTTSTLKNGTATYYVGDETSDASDVTEDASGSQYRAGAYADDDVEVTIKFASTVNSAKIVWHAWQVKKEDNSKRCYVEQIGTATIAEQNKAYTVHAGYELFVAISNKVYFSSLEAAYAEGSFTDNSVNYTNLLVADKISDSAFLNGGTGVVQDNFAGQSTSDYIDVSGIETIYSIYDVRSVYTYGYRSCAFYDGDKNFISGYNTKVTGTEIAGVTVPDGAVYARFGVASGDAMYLTNNGWYVGTNPEPWYGEFVK